MRATTSLEGDREEHVNRLREDHGATSDAEALRLAVDRSMQLEDARERVADLEARVDDLQRQLAAANQRIDAANELVEFARVEKHVVEQREQREREREAAGLLTRTRWWLFGRDYDGDNDQS
jgi:chromosome segregation ATPase